MNNYSQFREKLGKRVSRKLGNNTYLQVRDAESVAIKLHQTDVIVFYANGDIKLNSGGWRTVTTKARINEYLTDFYISQEKGVWYLSKSGTHENIGRYEDGLVIKSDGTFEKLLPLIPKMAAIDRNLKRKIKTYCIKFIDAMEKGEVKPSTGDCFFCLMRESKSDRALGEVMKSDHIKSHIEENYFVFSMLTRALEVFGASIAMREFVGQSIDGAARNVFAVDFVRDQTVKMLYRYICRQYGFAS